MDINYHLLVDVILVSGAVSFVLISKKLKKDANFRARLNSQLGWTSKSLQAIHYTKGANPSHGKENNALKSVFKYYLHGSGF